MDLAKFRAIRDLPLLAYNSACRSRLSVIRTPRSSPVSLLNRDAWRSWRSVRRTSRCSPVSLLSREAWRSWRSVRRTSRSSSVSLLSREAFPFRLSVRRTSRSSPVSLLSREAYRSWRSRQRATLFFGVSDSKREPCRETIARILACLLFGVSFRKVIILRLHCSWKRPRLDLGLWIRKRNNLLSRICCSRRSRSSFVSFIRILIILSAEVSVFPLWGPRFTFLGIILDCN